MTVSVHSIVSSCIEAAATASPFTSQFRQCNSFISENRSCVRHELVEVRIRKAKEQTVTPLSLAGSLILAQGQSKELHSDKGGVAQDPFKKSSRFTRQASAHQRAVEFIASTKHGIASGQLAHHRRRSTHFLCKNRPLSGSTSPRGETTCNSKGGTMLGDESPVPPRRF